MRFRVPTLIFHCGNNNLVQVLFAEDFKQTASRLLLAFPCLSLLLASVLANNDAFTGCMNIHQEKLIMGIRRKSVRGGPPSGVSRQVRERRKGCLAFYFEEFLLYIGLFWKAISKETPHFRLAPKQARRSGSFPVQARRGWLTQSPDNEDQEHNIAFCPACCCGPGGRQPDLQ